MLDLNIIPEKINQTFVKLEIIISDIKCLNEAGDLPCLMGKLNLIFLISRGTKNSNQCVKEKKNNRTILQMFYISDFSGRLRLFIVNLKPMVGQLCC